jgi:hypothetical protein
MNQPRILLSVFLLLGSCLAVHAQDAGTQQPSEQEGNHVFWREGAPGCDEMFIEGVRIRFLTYNDITVGLFILDVDGAYAFDVGVENHTTGRILLDPASAQLLYRKKSGHVANLYPLTPEKVAGKIRGRHKWGNILRAFAAGMATRTTTSTTTESGTFSSDAGSGTYQGNATTTTTEADDEALQRVQRGNARRSAADAAEADVASTTALRANTVFPGRLIHGFIYFEHKQFERAVFSIVVNGAMYSFGINNSK